MRTITAKAPFSAQFRAESENRPQISSANRETERLADRPRLSASELTSYLPNKG